MEQTASPSFTTTTSIRIDRELLTKYQAHCRDLNKSMNERIIEHMRRAVETTSEGLPEEKPHLTAASESQLAEMLAMNVAAYVGELLRDKAWAKGIIERAQLRWPGGILQDRMAHYALEKIHLAENFSEWLTKRVEHFLKDSDVYLLVDAGSTNLWFCRFLWKHLSGLTSTDNEKKVTLITNNIPVAEAFAEQRQLRHFKDKPRIECELLGGEVEPWYAALVGKRTQSSLVSGTDKKERPGRYMALAAGNFLRLSQAGPGYPIPLVRGAGQKEIKDLYVASAHEVYVIAPLGKIFFASTLDINKALGLSLDSNAEHKKRAYQEVAVHKAKGQFVKLVTTLRNSTNSILLPHSAAVKASLGHDLDRPGNSASGDIQDLCHFCYPFDDHVKHKSFDEQVKVEFPHEATQNLAFMSRFFSVVR